MTQAKGPERNFNLNYFLAPQLLVDVHSAERQLAETIQVSIAIAQSFGRQLTGQTVFCILCRPNVCRANVFRPKDAAPDFLSACKSSNKCDSIHNSS